MGTLSGIAGHARRGCSGWERASPEAPLVSLDLVSSISSKRDPNARTGDSAGCEKSVGKRF
jgi:hypothetical protein